MHKQGELSMKRHPDGSEELSSKIYQGLLLPPDMLKDYKEVDPEFPARIFNWTEDESKHRRSFERYCVKVSLIMKIGNLVCSILAMGEVLLVAYLFMINGFASEGMWIALSTAGVVGIFIIKKYMTNSSGNNQEPL